MSIDTNLEESSLIASKQKLSDHSFIEQKKQETGITVEKETENGLRLRRGCGKYEGKAAKR